jgi:hypothetical protein
MEILERREEMAVVGRIWSMVQKPTEKEAFNGKIVRSLIIMLTADNEDTVFENTIRHCRFFFCDPLRDNKNRMTVAVT